MSDLQIEFFDSINDIDREMWQRLIDSDYPFLQYDFLQALEQCSVTTEATGWKVQHIVVTENQKPVACLPLYEKNHSYGEYVFDHAWAEAYERYGFAYHPKLVSAIPYTPMTGPRISVDSTLDDKDRVRIQSAILQACQSKCDDQKLSSLHVLFVEENVSQQLAEQDCLIRKGVHFQWFNKGYPSFDDFLSGFNSRKRKQVKKERAKVAQQGIRIEQVSGSNLTTNDWQQFHFFYQLTYAKRSGHGGYLSQHFFESIGRCMANNVMMVKAYHDEECVAAALFLFDSKTLYGRYWGCSQRFDFLHFECCYYQGIDFCIRHQLTRFDPGVQGEHKIQRGFEPVYTYSNHWIANAGFRDAIANFVDEESDMMAQYLIQTSAMLPFKEELTQD